MARQVLALVGLDLACRSTAWITSPLGGGGTVHIPLHTPASPPHPLRLPVPPLRALRLSPLAQVANPKSEYEPFDFLPPSTAPSVPPCDVHEPQAVVRAILDCLRVRNVVGAFGLLSRARRFAIEEDVNPGFSPVRLRDQPELPFQRFELILMRDT